VSAVIGKEKAVRLSLRLIRFSMVGHTPATCPRALEYGKTKPYCLATNIMQPKWSQLFNSDWLDLDLHSKHAKSST